MIKKTHSMRKLNLLSLLVVALSLPIVFLGTSQKSASNFLSQAKASCVRNKPTISLSLPSNSLKTGQSTTLSITIINNDSQECGGTYMVVYPTLPNGWKQSPDYFKEASVLPKNGRNFTTTIMPPANASGQFDIKENVMNISSNMAAAASVKINIGQTTCVRANPKIDISPALMTGTKGQGVTYKVDVTNNDTVGCPTTKFIVYSKPPQGWRNTSKDFTLSPSLKTIVPLDVYSPSSATSGVYPIEITVLNSTTGNFGRATAMYRV